MQNQFNSALKSNYLFRNIEISNITLEDLNLKIISLKEGEILFNSGDNSSSIYLVIEGEINLLTKHSFSKTTTAALISNEFFGQEEFFNNSPRLCTALAVKNSKLAEISKENLDVLLINYDGILDNLKDSLENIDKNILKNLEKLLKEAKENIGRGNSQVSIFNIETPNNSDLKSLNEIKKNKKIIDELKVKIQRYNDLIRKKEVKITSLYNRLDEYQNSNKQLTHMMDNQNEQLTRLLELEVYYKNEIKSFNSKISELKHEITNSDEEDSKAKDLVSTNEIELLELKNKLQISESNLKENLSQKKILEEHLIEYKSKIIEQNSIIENSAFGENSVIAGLTEEISVLKQKQASFEELEEKYSKSEYELGELQAKIKDYSNKLIQLEAKEKQLVETSSLNIKVQNDLERLQKELQNSKNDVKQNAKLLDENKSKYFEQREKIKSYENDLSKIRISNSEQSAELEKLKYLKENLINLEKEKNTIISNLNITINDIEQKYKSYDEDKEIRDNKISKQNVKIEDLKELNEKLVLSDKNKSLMIGDQSFKILQFEESKIKFNDEANNSKETISILQNRISSLNVKFEHTSNQLKYNENLNYEIRANLDIQKDEISKLIESEEELKKSDSHKKEIINSQTSQIDELKAKENFLKKADSEKLKIINRQLNRIGEIEANDADIKKNLEELTNKNNEISNQQNDHVVKILKLEAELGEKKNKFDGLSLQLKQIEEVSKSLTSNNESLQNEVNKLNYSINKKNEIIENQSNSLSSIEDEKNKIKNISFEKDEIIIKQSHNNSELEHNIERLKQQINENEETAKELGNTNNYLSEDLELLKKDLLVTKKKLSEINNCSSGKDEIINNKNSELEKYKKNLEIEKEKINELAGTIDLQKTEIDNQEKNKFTLKREIEEKELKLSNYENKQAELNSKNEALNVTNSKLSQTAEQYKFESENLSKRLNERIEKVNELDELAKQNKQFTNERTQQVEKLEISIANLNSILQEKELKIAGLRSKESELQKTNELNKQEKIDLVNGKEKINGQFGRLNDENKINIEEIEKLKSALFDRTKSEQVSLKSADEKLSKIPQLISNIDKQKSIIEDRDFNINSLTDSIENLNSNLKEKNEEIFKLNEILSSKEKSINELNNQSEESENNIEDSNFKHQEQEQKNKELLEKLTNSENTITKLDSSMVSLANQLESKHVDLKTKDTNILKLQDELFEFERKLGKDQLIMNKLNEELSALNKEKNKLTTFMKDNNLDLNQGLTNDDELTNINKFNEDFQNLTLEISLKTEENKNYKEKNSSLLAKIIEMENKIDNFEKIVNSDQETQDNNNNSKESEQFKNRIEILENELKEKIASNENLDGQITISESNKNEVLKNNNSLNEKINLLENKLKDEKELYQQEIHNKNEKLVRFEKLVSSKEISENETFEFEETISNLNNELQDLTDSKSSLEIILEEKRSIIEDQGKRLSYVKLEKTDKEIEFIKLKEHVEDYKNEITKLNRAKNNYKLEVTQNLEDMGELNKKVNSINKELEFQIYIEENLNETISNQVDKIAELQSKLTDVSSIEKDSNPIISNYSENVADAKEQTIENFSHEILKQELPKQELPKQELPKQELPKQELSNQELPKQELSNQEISKQDFLIEDESEIIKDSDDGKINITFSSPGVIIESTNNDNDFEEIKFEETEKEEDLILEKSVPVPLPIAESMDDKLEEQKENNFSQHTEFNCLFHGNVCVVTVNIPRATMEIASKFKSYLIEIIDQDNTQVVIDLSECEFVDSTVLGVLVASLKRSMSKKGDLRIVWGDNTESSMFYITRMDKVFKIFENLKDAVQSYIS